MNTNDLEDRVIDFAVSIVNIVEEIKNNYSGNYYGNQLIRSSGSPALNSGEARSAESHKDFVHKMGICLKELRESHNCLKIIFRANLFIGDKEKILKVLDENNPLISIFVASIKTSKNNNSKIVNR
ncbi:four helix bundle protein [Gelidibacter algens]|uniref:Four helix bundle protein n=1 Tax=Gelidibacter algens TaxID=49280 RepID=A0A1A7R4F1_9FLAO|nr:four helix bundle protein [Gelidibacter algens]OBX26349.1 four helix bundle protein [Gelidibacter algens]RAJ25858.1 four helix bundle protein [Gelidibacter algens]